MALFIHFNETGYCKMDFKPSNKFWTNNIIYSFHLIQLKCELINENPENYIRLRPRHNKSAHTLGLFTNLGPPN